MTQDSTAIALRASPVADAIRAYRLIEALRRVAPRAAPLALVGELAEAGLRTLEVTMDRDDAAGDLAAVRGRCRSAARIDPFVGVGTARTLAELEAARDAGADVAVAPVLHVAILAAVLAAGLPFVAGTYTRARRTGPGGRASRSLPARTPEIETIVTGRVDAVNAASFQAAGAEAVGIGPSLIGASAEDRRRMLAATSRRGT